MYQYGELLTGRDAPCDRRFCRATVGWPAYACSECRTAQVCCRNAQSHCDTLWPYRASVPGDVELHERHCAKV